MYPTEDARGRVCRAVGRFVLHYGRARVASQQVSPSARGDGCLSEEALDTATSSGLQ